MCLEIGLSYHEGHPSPSPCPGVVGCIDEIMWLFCFGLDPRVTIGQVSLLRLVYRCLKDEWAGLGLSLIHISGLTVNPEKVRFAQESISFLGHLVSHRGVTVDSERTRGIRDFPPPRDCLLYTSRCV